VIRGTTQNPTCFRGPKPNPFYDACAAFVERKMNFAAPTGRQPVV
jgi:hypothetical protein